MRDFNTIREWKKCVRGHRRSVQGEPKRLCFFNVLIEARDNSATLHRLNGLCVKVSNHARANNAKSCLHSFRSDGVRHVVSDVFYRKQFLIPTSLNESRRVTPSNQVPHNAGWTKQLRLLTRQFATQESTGDAGNAWIASGV